MKQELRRTIKMDKMTSKYPLRNTIKERNRVESSREMKARANLKKGPVYLLIYTCTDIEGVARLLYMNRFCTGKARNRTEQRLHNTTSST